MKRDAHYYAILAFCRACGFKKDSAQVIAYASQFVDDAKINLMFIDSSSHIPEHDLVENRSAFFNMATCHSYFRINTFNYEAMVNNTIAFHFVPGCKGENFTKRLRCKEEAPIILDIINDVFLEDDLIKLGIILHAYADSYTHQGFSGMLSKVNDIKNCKAITKEDLGLLYKILHFFAQFGRENYEKLFDRIMPAYGHGQALEFPDIPSLVWSYEFDESGEFNGSYKSVEIDNKERFKRAFNNIRKHLEDYLALHNQYLDCYLGFENFDILMDTLLSEGEDKKREKNWIRLLIEQGLFNTDDLDLITYDDNKWLKEAFRNFDPKIFDDRQVDGVQLADNFSNSNWYGFYRAVKWYKKKFFQYCTKYELSIPH
ncbi:DUF6765 family protein [Desulfosporosinus metallidurans]|uniref:Uncharacterized protein n=1 Tax=Desulfosporosinus metallidurans TaxID=1888891 RepID=A0A1Q8QW03_9FIRM|nr:DUF6765 family protein [Desulfosporosinus metallidurans]OLN31509.1 hypothetical protein DSOL_2534 [Desulfosporosinus metallidurans]